MFENDVPSVDDTGWPSEDCQKNGNQQLGVTSFDDGNGNEGQKDGKDQKQSLGDATHFSHTVEQDCKIINNNY